MKTTTSSRLKEIMQQMNLRQVDILKRAEPYCKQYNIKLAKNDLSQYVSGKVCPGQEKLTVLALALNVSETWLMGYDVPVERNDYEDSTLLRFDVELEDAFALLEKAGYLLASNNDDDTLIIKDNTGNIIACMHDYELVNKYESLLKKGALSAQSLAEVSFSLSEKQNEVRKEYIQKHHISYYESQMLKSFSLLNDDNKKKSIAYTKTLLSTQQMEEDLLAAHARTDIAAAPEDTQHDLDIMDDDSLWE